MIPLSFDSETSRAIIGDDQARIIEAKARSDADSNICNLPEKIFCDESYFNCAMNEMRIVIYIEQYKKRLARNARKVSISRDDVK